MGYMQELAALYEGHQGQAIDFGPNVRYSVTDAGPSATDKQPLPTTSPGGSQYSPVNIGYNTGTATVEDEEEPKRPLKHKDLMKHINDELHKAKSFGMDYAVMVLAELKRKIKQGA
ncbi:MAG: hypothetical protein EBU90_19995 [Proteobacteria bacterium]|nr:hypothetical protein [Pseudomonadota bacterium]